MFINQMSPMARHPLTVVAPDARLCEVADLLSSEHVNLVIVCGADGSMVGVIDDTDIVRSVSGCGGSRYACRTQARDVMTTAVVSCSTSDCLRDIWLTMKAQGLRHLPATDQDGKPVAVIHACDVLLSLFEETEQEEHDLRDYFLSLGGPLSPNAGVCR